MKKQKNDSSTWLWYAVKSNIIDLDASVYPSFDREDGVFSVPDWVCRMPDDGLHLKMDFRRLDVHVSRLPSRHDQIAATEYSVKLVRMDWFHSFSKSIDRKIYVLGDVILFGSLSTEWKTIVTRSVPRLRRQKEVLRPACPICGYDNMSYHVSGKYWLDERDKSNDAIMVTTKGIFLSEDIALKNDVKVPGGSFKPSRLRFQLSR